MDPAFTRSVQDALYEMRFRPAIRGTQKVRQLVHQRFTFQIQLPPRQGSPAAGVKSCAGFRHRTQQGFKVFPPASVVGNRHSNRIVPIEDCSRRYGNSRLLNSEKDLLVGSVELIF